jgi:hypothetical protein
MKPFRKLNQENLPEPKKLCLIRRKQYKNHNGLYIGYRTSHELSTNSDPSRDCYWHGSQLSKMDLIEFGTFSTNSCFSDITVDSWMYLSEIDDILNGIEFNELENIINP